MHINKHLLSILYYHQASFALPIKYFLISSVIMGVIRLDILLNSTVFFPGIQSEVWGNSTLCNHCRWTSKRLRYKIDEPLETTCTWCRWIDPFSYLCGQQCCWLFCQAGWCIFVFSAICDSRFNLQIEFNQLVVHILHATYHICYHSNKGISYLSWAWSIG